MVGRQLAIPRFVFHHILACEMGALNQVQKRLAHLLMLIFLHILCVCMCVAAM